MKNLLGLPLFLSFLFLLAGCFDSRDDKVGYRPQSQKSVHAFYVVAVHPYLNSKKTYLSYRPILDYLESRIEGAKFELQTAADYQEYEKKLYSGAYDFALPNPYQTVNSLEFGYRVIAKMRPDSVFRGIIVARKAQHIRDVKDLKGQTVSFPAKTALAAAMMPIYFLHESGIDIKKDIKIKYVGSQFSSIMNAYASDAIAAATWPPPWEQWKRENPDMAKEMEVVWTTEPLVNNGFVVKNSVDKDIAAKVAQFLISLSENDEGRKLLQNAGFDGFEYANESTYNPVKEFLKKYDTAIGLPK